MTTNNFGSIPSMLFTQYKLICFFVSIKLLFYNIFIGFFIINKLFLGSINTFNFYKINVKRMSMLLIWKTKP